MDFKKSKTITIVSIKDIVDKIFYMYAKYFRKVFIEIKEIFYGKKIKKKSFYKKNKYQC